MLQNCSRVDFGLLPSSHYFNSAVRDDRSCEKIGKKELISTLCKPSKLLANSVLRPGVEQLECLPSHLVSQEAFKEKQRTERDKTSGIKWYDLPATPLDDEMKNDLTLIRMRESIFRNNHYKGGHRDKLPKYFQMGTVMDTPADFYRHRVPKKQRKQTVVDELLADAQFRKVNKEQLIGFLKAEKKKIWTKTRSNSVRLVKKRHLVKEK